ncbi:MAG: hypothetical protein RLZZ628_2110 [Bacteroidota bacterium]
MGTQITRIFQIYTDFLSIYAQKIRVNLKNPCYLCSHCITLYIKMSSNIISAPTLSSIGKSNLANDTASFCQTNLQSHSFLFSIPSNAPES